VVGPGGGDLDTGESGKSHNLVNVPGSTLKYCLTGCNGTTNTMCQASGPTGQGSINGPTFGPPLPLFSANVAVCVVNNFRDPQVQATVDLATGKFDATATPLNLASATYQGTPTQVCPKCVSGMCDSGKNQGKSCTVDGTVLVNNPPNIVDVSYPVSRDCPPGGTPLGTPNVSMPLTSGTSMLAGNAAGTFPCPGQIVHDECGGSGCTLDCSATQDPKGGINQTCCNDASKTPCFPSATGPIVRIGNVTVPSPALPDQTYPKTGQSTLAATYCIPSTGSITVDATAGLPGPGALLLPVMQTFSKAP
jgi:hypothetical protein